MTIVILRSVSDEGSTNYLFYKILLCKFAGFFAGGSRGSINN